MQVLALLGSEPLERRVVIQDEPALVRLHLAEILQVPEDLAPLIGRKLLELLEALAQGILLLRRQAVPFLDLAALRRPLRQGKTSGRDQREHGCGDERRDERSS